MRGGVICWGNGQFINGSYGVFPSPVWINGWGPGSGVTSLCAGHSHNCLIKEGKVYCWGANSQFQSGQPSIVYVPTLVSGISANVSRISCGAYHTCVVLIDQTARCWGSNVIGELGIGSTSPSKAATPQPVFAFNDVVDIVAGFYATCAVRLVSSEKETWCWGHNTYGQLGLGNTTSPMTQAARVNPDYPQSLVSLPTGGYYAFCGIANHNGGAAYCSGRGAGGHLGNGDDNNRNTLTPVAGLGSNVHQMSMSVASSRACAVTKDGSAFCWGQFTSSFACCLGNGESSTTAMTPQRVDEYGPQNFIQVAVGYYTVCAVRWVNIAKNNYGVWCWGDNIYGGIGSPYVQVGDAPVTFPYIQIDFPD